MIDTDPLESADVEATDPTSGDSTPWLGVHVLTEFIFCPRAGLIAFEAQHDDPGQDELFGPSLDYLPDYAAAIIEEALQQTWRKIWRLLICAPPAVVFLAGIGWLFGWWLTVMGVAFAVPLLKWLWRQCRVVAILGRRLKLARRTVPCEPDPGLKKIESVNWWALLNAGFTAVDYEDPYQDEDWKLAGKPWRVLHKGSLRIPVFRKRRGKPELYPQHFVRMAAYCRLIAMCEGTEPPYAVVLFGDGYNGVAVPNDPGVHEALESRLDETRRLIQAVQSENLQPAPPNKSICHQCHLGCPRVHRSGHTDTVFSGSVIEPYRTRANDNRIYHSICGDRFRWVPPHDRAAEKELI